MLDSLVARLSRRKALKLGAGLVAVAAAAGPLEMMRAFAAGPSSTSDLINGVGTVEAIQENTAVDGTVSRSVVARIVGGEVVSAKLTGFPSDVSPRIGDLVAVDMRTSKPLCAPTGIQTVIVQPTAVPLTSWSLGIPAMEAGVIRIANVRLVPNAEVLDAAQRRATIAVGTLDSTLPDRQVLATRTP
jgi:hypothetical protein